MQLWKSSAFQDFRDSSGSNWASVSLENGVRSPDSNLEIGELSALCFTSLCKKLGLSSRAWSAVLDKSLKPWTCWRQTWTASCTLTKYHSLPIISTTPDLDKVSRTSLLGFEMAICTKKVMSINTYSNTNELFETSSQGMTWMSRNLYSWCKSFKAWTALESIYVTAALKITLEHKIPNP